VSVKEIRLFGDPVLRTPALEVVDFDRELRQLVADLTDTMVDAPGAFSTRPTTSTGSSSSTGWTRRPASWP
jgi:peptide deformylase